MGWALAFCFIVGASVALWVPVLGFTVAIFVIACVFVVVWYLATAAIWSAIGWAAAVVVFLEIGYVFTHAIAYFVYVRRPNARRYRDRGQSR